MKGLRIISFLIVFFVFISPVYAEVAVEYGITAGTQGLSKNQKLVTTYGVGSMDLVVDADIGSGVLHMYIEGASDAGGSAAEVVDGANLDAGTAADANGNGRVQLSELAYVFGSNSYSVAVGVQNLFAFADGNSTSNAETEQFMAVSLVNNPTIAMPDYTPSIVVNIGKEGHANATFMAARGTGLADNGEPKDDFIRNVTKDLLPDGTKKGAFALAEFRLEDKDVWLSVGAWNNTRQSNPLSGGYINLDSAEDELFSWSFRYGTNNDKVGTSQFASFTTSHAIGSDVLGIGYSSQRYSATTIDTKLVECYYRWQLSDSLALTPDIQLWWDANGMRAPAAGMTGGRIIVYGLRMQFGDAFSF